MSDLLDELEQLGVDGNWSRILLRLNAYPDAALGQTAVHRAVDRGLPAHLAALLAHGGDLYLKSQEPDPEDAFQIAKRRARFHPQVLRVLLSRTRGPSR